jgi:starch phosphorylase
MSTLKLSQRSDIRGYKALEELALDLRSYWNHCADDIWRQLDEELWDLTRNPWTVLQTVSIEKLEKVLGDQYSS